MARVLLFAVALATAAVCNPVQAQPDTTIRSAADDAALAVAHKQARDTLPVFWTKFRAHADDYSRFAVKAAFRTDDDRGEEALWVAVLNVSDGQVHGRLASAPEAIRGLRPGQPVTFDSSQIVDWQYVKGGRAYGHFSTRALMARVSAAERAEAMGFLAPTPLEAGDR